MKNIILIALGFSLSFLLGFTFNHTEEKLFDEEIENVESKPLGAFSISLNVTDIKASKAFYETLGFTVLGGDLKYNYLIMKSDNALIGLFQGMFENNILTFNPGWDENGQNIEEFDDIRDIQKRLKESNIKFDTEIDAKPEGPANFVLTDPDGNLIFFDQHR